MKKLFVLSVLAILSVLCFGLGLIGCVPAEQTPTPTHVYSTEWSYDVEYHYKKCTEQGCDSVSEKGLHKIENRVCKDCGYTLDYIEVTPNNIYEKLKSTEVNKFKLLPGNYANMIYLTNKSNITLFADGDAKVKTKITLTETNSNITFKGLSFETAVITAGVEVLGTTNGLNIENCTFTGNSQIVSKGEGNIITDLVIDGCKFTSIIGNQLSAMVVQTVSNFTVKNCTFDDVQYNAMQIGSFKLGGNVTVINNTFKEINNRMLYFVTPDENVVWNISGNTFYECGSGKDDGNYIKVANKTIITIGVNTWEVVPELETFYFVRSFTEDGQSVNTVDGVNIDLDAQLTIS